MSRTFRKVASDKGKKPKTNRAFGVIPGEVMCAVAEEMYDAGAQESEIMLVLMKRFNLKGWQAKKVIEQAY